MMVARSLVLGIAASVLAHHRGWRLRQGIFATLFAAYLPWLLDGTERRPAGRPWRALQHSSLWAPLLRFLFGRAELVVETPEKLRACKQGILAVAPHGVVSFNHALYMTDVCGFLSQHWPVDRRDLGASAIFMIPVYRDLLLWCGCVDASASNARAVLRSGRSIFVYPGGEAEQMRSRRGRYFAHWGSRKGFVKLAVEFGVPVIPSYAFGEADMYNTSSILLGFRMWVCSTFKVALPLAFGRWGTPLPRKVPLVAVVGEPIQVPKVDPLNPNFESAVDKAHAEVLEALVKLFDKHKAKYIKDGGSEAAFEITGNKRS